MSLVDLGKRLLESAKTGATDEVRTLMSNGAPFTTDWLGTSPLHFASQFGHVETAEVLLRAGISRDARTKVDRTPLHVAAQEGHGEIVELLLKNGADIEAKDMLKMTPLHWAVEKGHLGVIELLLAHSADMNCENKFEKTAVDIAIGNTRNDIVEILQLSGQNIVEVTTSEQGVIEEIPLTETLVVGDSQMDGQITYINVKTEDGGHRSVPVSAATLRAMDGSGEQSSTAVLATLAALAEATAPNNNTTTTTATDALSWLESQGITMIAANDNSTIVSSGLQAGQTLTLTEAGKLALNNFVQKDGDVEAEIEEGVEGEITEEHVVGIEGMNGEQIIEEVETETVDDGQTQQVYTIVTESGELQTVEASELVAAGHEGVQMMVSVPAQDENEPLMKRIKLEVDEEYDDSTHHLVISTGDEGVVTEEDALTGEEALTGGEEEEEEAVEVLVATNEEYGEEGLTEEEVLVDGGLEEQEVLEVELEQHLEEENLEPEDGDGSLEQDELRRQLEAVQREAEQYKLQLREKEEQAEQYKKQLTQIAKTS